MPTLTQPEAKAQAPTSDRFVRAFNQLDRGSTAIAGGKGSNLAELTRAGFPVPAGFVVLVPAYEAALKASNASQQLSAALKDLDVDDTDALQTAAKAAAGIVRGLKIPEDVAREIAEAYQRLDEDDASPTVAVRSSATAEDAPSASFAGMFESFLEVRGRDKLLSRVRDCWASSYSPRVLFYRAKQSMPSEMPVAVVVQKMIASEKSGIIFTANPATHDTSSVVIEASTGLGDAVVQGQVTPDRYVLDKKTLGVREMKIVDAESGRVLTDAELTTLGQLAIKAESHFGAPQDLEFAIDSHGTYLTQTRPITTLSGIKEKSETPGEGRPPIATRIMVRGMGASPGVATGPVRVLVDAAGGAVMKQGDVLVAHMTSPDWVPLMRKAAAIVTDAGGMTSHAAIVSRELRVPCVVGTRDGTRVLHPDMRVTVDGSAGTVSEAGATAAAAPSPTVATPPAMAERGPMRNRVVTATRLYVNLADPAQAESVAAQDVDGVGLLRAEFMLLDALGGTHPEQLLAEGKRDELLAKLSAPLTRIAAAFQPRPVIYRAMDFRSNEFRSLRGGEAHEPVEANPMIGYRGCYRYVEEPELFGVELQALYEARKQNENLHLMIPFVRTEWELRRCLELVDRSPLGEGRGLQRWVMAEVPSVIWRMHDYAALGITAVSIGSNDLTQLVLGVDRDNERLAPLYDERDAAVLAAIREIVERAHAAGLTVSICGQAPSVHPEYADFLVGLGIDSISVVPDALEATRLNIARAEQRQLLRRVRQA